MLLALLGYGGISPVVCGCGCTAGVFTAATLPHQLGNDSALVVFVCRLLYIYATGYCRQARLFCCGLRGCVLPCKRRQVWPAFRAHGNVAARVYFVAFCSAVSAGALFVLRMVLSFGSCPLGHLIPPVLVCVLASYGHAQSFLCFGIK